MLLSVVLAAVLGVPDAGFAAPPAQEFLLAQAPVPAGTGVAGVAVAPATAEWARVRILARPAVAAGLVDAHVFEKYRSFRESLTTP